MKKQAGDLGRGGRVMMMDKRGWKEDDTREEDLRQREGGGEGDRRELPQTSEFALPQTTTKSEQHNRQSCH